MAETHILEYYYAKGKYIVFNNYTMDTTGVVRNKYGKELNYKLTHGYYKVSVVDNDGKPRTISIARAVASTFLGEPPTLQHTADHIISNQKTNNNVSNIRWACKTEQVNNRSVPDTYKSSFVIVKDDLEMTAKEWADYLKDTNNPYGRKYTAGMIGNYARGSQHGFSYKEYPNLDDEVWKLIKDSDSARDTHWEISNKSRVKYVTKHASSVLSGERLGWSGGYPCIGMHGQMKYCHILSFEAFCSDAPRGDLMVLHKHDDKTDFRPENLRLGSQSENTKDAYDNGKFCSTKTARTKCVSYINGILEKEHDSQRAAAEYLRVIGYKKAQQSAISLVLSNNLNSAYGRTWKLTNSHR